MSLKQNIVVKSEYTISDGCGGGSRGGTPGQYVLRYALRSGATEVDAPIRKREADDYIQLYMSRKNATEVFESLPIVRDAVSNAAGLGGVAFGNNSVSYSDEEIRKVAKDTQTAFDKGKTVMKTILSFDTDYLKKMNVIRPDFEVKRAGDFFGNVDQMKVRVAIMKGMARMGRSFDDLKWCGAIQFDTKHLHCHLSMYDNGNGFVMSDGTQKGKLSAKQMSDLRRGVDLGFDEMHPIKIMSANVTKDRQNVKTFVKKFIYESINKATVPQFLLTCLPENKNHWTFNSNRKDMRKANEIASVYVEQLFLQPSSGYDKAMSDINKYANHRQKEESLSDMDHNKLVVNGRARLVTECVNGVYRVLKDIPEEQRVINTKMIDFLSMDYETLAKIKTDDPMVEFSYKLRSYSSRLNHHKDEVHKNRTVRKLYEEQYKDNKVSPGSRAIYDFCLFEEQYNAMLLCKYQHFLSFVPSNTEYQDEFDELIKKKKEVDSFLELENDLEYISNHGSDLERYVLQHYGISGGRHFKVNPALFERRRDEVVSSFNSLRSDFEETLADSGLTLAEENGELKVSSRKPYTFNAVKALDIHHLVYDFTDDVRVSEKNIESFSQFADKRSRLLTEAVAYLKSSDQYEFMQTLPHSDVKVMKDFSNMLKANGTLVSKKDILDLQQEHIYTVPIDHKCVDVIKSVVSATIHATTFAVDREK